SYGAKIRAADVCVRVVEVRSIRHAKGFRLKLEGKPFGNLEVSHQAHVEIEVPRATQNVAAGIAEYAGSRNCCETIRIKIRTRQVVLSIDLRTTRPRSAIQDCQQPSNVRRLSVSRSIQKGCPGTAVRDGKGVPLKALNTQFNCHPPASALTMPDRA